MSDGCVDRLPRREDFWAIAVFEGKDVVGGLTAHVLSMTRTESSEVFLYDVAGRGRREPTSSRG